MSNRRTNFEENKFPSNPNSMEQQTPIVLYLNEKLRLLEAENNELKKEISLKSNEKEKIDYYLRLRKEMLEQIESLKCDNVSKDLHYKNEIEKLNETLNKMTERINEKRTLEEDYVNQTSPLKYNDKENKSVFDVNRQSLEAKSKLNKSTKMTNDRKSKTKYFQNILPEANSEIFSYDDFKLSQHVKTQELLLAQNNNNQQNDEDKTQHNSAYVTIIGDLEDKLSDYNRVLKLRDEEINNLKLELNSLKGNSAETKESLLKEVENWKQKYLSLFNSNKTLGEEFSEFHSKKNETYRKENDKNIYSFQKKVLHLEKLCAKYESDLESMSQQYTNKEAQKQLEIENLKFNVKKIIENYDQINKTYEENLKSMVLQLDNFKRLYLTREGEFMELTEYYCRAIEEYSKPLSSAGRKERVFELEDLYGKQTKEVERLKKELDNYIKENTILKNQMIEGKPEIRSKISEAMKTYETSLSEIKETHDTLKVKLGYLEKFVTYFDEQFKFFNSLIEEKKKLEEYVVNLECEIKMMDIHSKEEEILLLKEQNIKLAKDLEIKQNLIKEYESVLAQNNTAIGTERKKAKEVSGDILMKLNTEISILTNQVVSLNKTKDSIEKFYKTELKNCLDKVKEKSDKIEDLQNVISKLQHDFSAKKETIFNLWLLEFKEFKENLLTMNEIKNVVNKFHIEGEELKINSDRIYSEELLMLRDEMKVKDDLIKELKKNNDEEKNKLNTLIDSYKNTMNVKQSALDTLIQQKQLELQALTSEKQALIKMEKQKEETREKETKAWNDQKELLNTLVITQFESKDKEISLLKNHVEILHKELNSTKENYQKDIENILKSVEAQLNLVKDRELFTVSQLVELEERFNALKDEKERITQLLKEENEDLKTQNRVLSKLRGDSTTIQSKMNLSDIKK